MYCTFFNKTTIITNFLAFFLFFLLKFFPPESGSTFNLWIRIQKENGADPCGSGSKALVLSKRIR